MEPPTITCTYCGRKRDATRHMRADFPPDAARKWLRRNCPHQGAGPSPCEFRYRAGVDVEGLRAALKRERSSDAER